MTQPLKRFTYGLTKTLLLDLAGHDRGSLLDSQWGRLLLAGATGDAPRIWALGGG